MGKAFTDDKYYKEIANAIREKNGSTAKYTPAQMAQAILEIKSTDNLRKAQPDVIYGSAYQGDTQTPDKAFDGNTNTLWYFFRNSTTIALPYLVVTYNTPVALKAIEWYMGSGDRVREFSILGSNDNSNFTPIFTGEIEDVTGWTTFNFVNSTVYKYYKISIDSLWAAYYMTVREINLWKSV